LRDRFCRRAASYESTRIGSVVGMLKALTRTFALRRAFVAFV